MLKKVNIHLPLDLVASYEDWARKLKIPRNVLIRLVLKRRLAEELKKRRARV